MHMPLIAKKRSTPTMSLSSNGGILLLRTKPTPIVSVQHKTPEPEANPGINFRSMRDNLRGKRSGCSACRGAF